MGNFVVNILSLLENSDGRSKVAWNNAVVVALIRYLILFLEITFRMFLSILMTEFFFREVRVQWYWCWKILYRPPHPHPSGGSAKTLATTLHIENTNQVRKKYIVTCSWHQKTNSPIHEFKVLQNVFRIKKTRLKMFLK